MDIGDLNRIFYSIEPCLKAIDAAGTRDDYAKCVGKILIKRIESLIPSLITSEDIGFLLLRSFLSGREKKIK